MRSFMLAVALVLIGPVLGVNSAAAWPVIQVTATESVGTPMQPRVRTHFTVDFAGTGPISDGFVLRLIDGNLMFDCQAPLGWSCVTFFEAPSSSATLYRRVDGPLPPPALAFAVDTRTGEPCLRFYFSTSPHDVADYDFTGCLLTGGPTPAARSSWGTLKSLYR